ncbi:hypothetical protein R1flu_006760 [Riccia fluitans]|uniref:Uncharacterized protein n=1 Tax=Riccia fluitans TaxID=41844 RepID=A0ABD1YWX6_9MARC
MIDFCCLSPFLLHLYTQMGEFNHEWELLALPETKAKKRKFIVVEETESNLEELIRAKEIKTESEVGGTSGLSFHLSLIGSSSKEFSTPLDMTPEAVKSTPASTIPMALGWATKLKEKVFIKGELHEEITPDMSTHTILKPGLDKVIIDFSSLLTSEVLSLVVCMKGLTPTFSEGGAG